MISGKSVGTLDELTSLLRRCRRCDNLLAFGDLDFDFSLARDVDDAAEAAEELRARPLKKRLVRDSLCPSVKEGGPEDSVEENVGGEMISCVWVSDLMNVKMGLVGPSSCWTSRRASGAAGASLSATFSFFLSISRRGMLCCLPMSR